MNYISRVGIEFKTVGLQKVKNISGKSNTEITRIVFACVQGITNVEYELILSNKRHKEIREARQLVHYFLKKYTGYSLDEIGKQTKNNHCTVIHSIKVVEADCSDRIYKINFEKIEQEIKYRINR